MILFSPSPPYGSKTSNVRCSMANGYGGRSGLMVTNSPSGARDLCSPQTAIETSNTTHPHRTNMEPELVCGLGRDCKARDQPLPKDIFCYRCTRPLHVGCFLSRLNCPPGTPSRLRRSCLGCNQPHHHPGVPVLPPRQNVATGTSPEIVRQ
jgi:hypothetical protein